LVIPFIIIITMRHTLLCSLHALYQFFYAFIKDFLETNSYPAIYCAFSLSMNEKFAKT